jgi:hypothetical protein
MVTDARKCQQLIAIFELPGGSLRPADLGENVTIIDVIFTFSAMEQKDFELSCFHF